MRTVWVPLVLSAAACGSSGGNPSPAANGVTIDVTMTTACTDAFCSGGPSLCPVVTPNPASVKTGQAFRWANVLGDAGTFVSYPTTDAGAAEAGSGDAGYEIAPPSVSITLFAADGTPLETVAPGQVGGWIATQAPTTFAYSLTTMPAGTIACLPSGTAPALTVYVTAN